MKKRIQREYESLTVGLMFPVSIAVGLVIGYLLDRLFNIFPILTVIFLFYGIAAAFINLFKLAKKDHENEK
jgi:ATP synthase protein I